MTEVMLQNMDALLLISSALVAPAGQTTWASWEPSPSQEVVLAVLDTSVQPQLLPSQDHRSHAGYPSPEPGLTLHCRVTL